MKSVYAIGERQAAAEGELAIGRGSADSELRQRAAAARCCCCCFSQPSPPVLRLIDLPPTFHESRKPVSLVSPRVVCSVVPQAADSGSSSLDAPPRLIYLDAALFLVPSCSRCAVMSSPVSPESLVVVIDCSLDSESALDGTSFASFINAVLFFLHAYTAVHHNHVSDYNIRIQ